MSCLDQLSILEAHPQSHTGIDILYVYGFVTGSRSNVDTNIRSSASGARTTLRKQTGSEGIQTEQSTFHATVRKFIERNECGEPCRG